MDAPTLLPATPQLFSLRRLIRRLARLGNSARGAAVADSADAIEYINFRFKWNKAAAGIFVVCKWTLS